MSAGQARALRRRRAGEGYLGQGNRAPYRAGVLARMPYRQLEADPKFVEMNQNQNSAIVSARVAAHILAVTALACTLTVIAEVQDAVVTAV